MKWSVLSCSILIALWLLPPASLGATDGRSATPIAPVRATCPERVKGSATLPAAVTTNETFFVVGPLSSSLSPIVSENIPLIQYSGPGTVLTDDGLCFSHFGDRGGLTIVSKLFQYRITHITIDNSAADRITHHPYHPREGRLWGLIEGDLPPNLTTRSMHTISDKATYVRLGTFCFDPASSASQTYTVEDGVTAYSQLKFSVFYLEIENNWGGSHTCLCYLEMHGEG